MSNRPDAPATEKVLRDAVAHVRDQRDHEAERLCLELIAEEPNCYGALALLGDIAQRQERLNDAMSLFSAALAARPKAPDVLAARALVLRRLDRHEEALRDLNTALGVQPRYFEALFNRGNVLLELERPEDALASFELALVERPRNIDIRRSVATVLSRLSRHAEALPWLDELERDHGTAESAVMLGTALQAGGREEEALAAFDDALARQPGLHQALTNRGNVLLSLGRYDEALHCYRQVLAEAPEDASANVNFGIACLTTGDFERGWEHYEWRRPSKRGDPVGERRAVPDWTGRENLRGATVVLYTEQGFGDAIQFVRYAPEVAARGAGVVLVCPPALVSLFRTVDGIDRVFADSEDVPLPTFRSPLMSLPRAFETGADSIPAEVPYVAADPARVDAWRQRLAEVPGGRKIGLVWRGNPANEWALRRDCPAESLAPLLEVPDCAFFSLQLEEGAEDIAGLQARGLPVVDLATELGDFYETAAAMSALDLVITVDTAAAHLAGALARPTWVLLPAFADWRWLTDRDDSPWYPTTRLFRQPERSDWTSVIARVADELADA